MTKIVNYTPEQVATIVEGYKAGESVEVLAAKIGKSVRSVVAKLSNEKVYVAKDAGTTRTTRTTKAELITKIATAKGVDVAKLESLEKASKEALEILAA